jgi:hypothetical protein
MIKCLFLLVVLSHVEINVHAQECRKAITRGNFFSSLQLGRKEKKDASFFEETIRREGVGFRFTERDGRELIRKGAFLGKDGLARVRDAIKSSYCSAKGGPSISQTITNSPGAIQSAGNLTINTPATPPRVIPDELKAEIVAALSKRKSKVTVYSVINDREAALVATQLYSLLKQAGWEMLEEQVRFLMPVGIPLSGINMKWKGKLLAPGQVVNIPLDDPRGVLGLVFKRLNFACSVLTYPDIPEGVIYIEVYSQK